MPHRFITLVPVTAIALAATLSPAHAKPAVGYEEQVLTAANHARSDHGLRPLRRARCLASFAEAHARRMAARRTTFHQDAAVLIHGCRLRRVAENVAVGHVSGASAVQAGWMQSPVHRANLLARGHRLTAVAAVQDELGVWWTVQLLGRR